MLDFLNGLKTGARPWLNVPRSRSNHLAWLADHDISLLMESLQKYYDVPPPRSQPAAPSGSNNHIARISGFVFDELDGICHALHVNTDRFNLPTFEFTKAGRNNTKNNTNVIAGQGGHHYWGFGRDWP